MLLMLCSGVEIEVLVELEIKGVNPRRNDSIALVYGTSM